MLGHLIPGLPIQAQQIRRAAQPPPKPQSQDLKVKPFSLFPINDFFLVNQNFWALENNFVV
jgi:hypothetical protein